MAFKLYPIWLAPNSQTVLIMGNWYPKWIASISKWWGHDGDCAPLSKPSSVIQDDGALWQMTEHVASRWPLTRKPFPHHALLCLTDGPKPEWPLATGALLCKWSITSEKVRQGWDQKQANSDLSAAGCRLWYLVRESRGSDKLETHRQMTDKIDTIACN